MRKARRVAEMQHDPGQMPYPQYGYPATQPDPSTMYMQGPGGYGNQQAPMNYSPAPGGYGGFPPQHGQQMMGPGPEQSNFGIPSQFLQNPAVANMALQYGQSMLGQTKDRIDQELNKYYLCFPYFYVISLLFTSILHQQVCLCLKSKVLLFSRHNICCKEVGSSSLSIHKSSKCCLVKSKVKLFVIEFNLAGLGDQV